MPRSRNERELLPLSEPADALGVPLFSLLPQARHSSFLRPEQWLHPRSLLLKAVKGQIQAFSEMD